MDHEALPFYDSVETMTKFWNIVCENFDMAASPWNTATSEVLRNIQPK